MASQIDIRVLAKDLASAVIKGITNETKSLASTAGEVGRAYADFGQKVLGVGLLGATALTGLGISAIKSADELKQNRIAFETMLGSATKAETLLKDIRKFGLSTPFENKQLVEGAKQLLAYNFSQEQIIPTMKDLGDISAGLGMDKLPVLIRALGQVSAKGKLMGGEMLQIRETGLNLTPVLAKMRGVTEEAFNAKDITEWNISAKEVQIAMNKIATSQFSGLMEKQSKTVSGMVSNLQDFGASLLNTVGGIDEAGNIIKGGLMESVSEQIGNLLKMLDENAPAIQNFALQLGKLFGGAISKGVQLFGDLRNAVVPFVELAKQNKDRVLEFLKVFGALTGIAVVVGIVVALANPFTAILLLITLISVAVVALKTAWETNFMGIQDKTNAFVGVLQSIWNWISLYILPLVQMLGQALITAFQMSVEAWNRWNLTGIIISGFQLVWTFITAILEGIGRSFEIVSLLIQGKFGDAWTKIIEYFNWGLGKGQEILGKMADFMGNVFKGATGIIKDAINGAIIDPLNRGIDSLNGIINETRKIPGMGGINNVGKIPRLAQGVNNVPADMLAVIHKGEAVVPAKMNPFNPNSSQNGIGGSTTIQVIIQGTVLGVDNLIETVARGVEEGQARKNKLSQLNLS